MTDLRGINLAMMTPFKADGAIDFAKFEDLIERYLDTGMHGFVFSSGTGQHAYLTEAECNKLFEVGIKRVNGRAKVIAQTSALNMEEVLRRSQSAQDLGADALMILPPFFEGPRHDDGIFRFYEAIDKAVSVDIIGYNIPAATGIELTPALYTRLNELPNFNYIKDSSGDIGKQQALMSCGGKILNGADPIAPFSFMLGTAGTIWGGAGIFPRHAVQLFELIEAGKYKEGLALWQKMIPIINFLWQGDYIPAAKAAARMMGYDGGHVRFPVCEVGPKVEAEMAPLLALLKD